MPEHIAFISRRHALFLAQTLGMGLVDYTLLFHSDYMPFTFKTFLDSALYWLLRGMPTNWVSATSRFAHRLAQQRSKGVQNFHTQPDHAFVILQRA